MAPIQIRHSIVKPLTMDNTLKCIIYASDPGMPIKSAVNLENPHKEMLKFSVHVVRSLKQQIKVKFKNFFFFVYISLHWIIRWHGVLLFFPILSPSFTEYIL